MIEIYNKNSNKVHLTRQLINWWAILADVLQGYPVMIARVLFVPMFVRGSAEL